MMAPRGFPRGVNSWPVVTIGLPLVNRAKNPGMVGGKFGIAHGVLNILVSEVMLQGSRVVAVVSELIAAGVAKHVRMHGNGHLGGLAEALDSAPSLSLTINWAV